MCDYGRLDHIGDTAPVQREGEEGCDEPRNEQALLNMLDDAEAERDHWFTQFKRVETLLTELQEQQLKRQQIANAAVDDLA